MEDDAIMRAARKKRRATEVADEEDGQVVCATSSPSPSATGPLDATPIHAQSSTDPRPLSPSRPALRMPDPRGNPASWQLPSSPATLSRHLSERLPQDAPSAPLQARGYDSCYDEGIDDVVPGAGVGEAEGMDGTGGSSWQWRPDPQIAAPSYHPNPDLDSGDPAAGPPHPGPYGLPPRPMPPPPHVVSSPPRLRVQPPYARGDSPLPEQSPGHAYDYRPRTWAQYDTGNSWDAAAPSPYADAAPSPTYGPAHPPFRPPRAHPASGPQAARAQPPMSPGAMRLVPLPPRAPHDPHFPPPVYDSGPTGFQEPRGPVPSSHSAGPLPRLPPDAYPPGAYGYDGGYGDGYGAGMGAGPPHAHSPHAMASPHYPMHPQNVSFEAQRAHAYAHQPYPPAPAATGDMYPGTYAAGSPAFLSLPLPPGQYTTYSGGYTAPASAVHSPYASPHASTSGLAGAAAAYGGPPAVAAAAYGNAAAYHGSAAAYHAAAYHSAAVAAQHTAYNAAAAAHTSAQQMHGRYSHPNLHPSDLFGNATPVHGSPHAVSPTPPSWSPRNSAPSGWFDPRQDAAPPTAPAAAPAGNQARSPFQSTPAKQPLAEQPGRRVQGSFEMQRPASHELSRAKSWTPDNKASAAAGAVAGDAAVAQAASMDRRGGAAARDLARQLQRAHSDQHPSSKSSSRPLSDHPRHKGVSGLAALAQVWGDRAERQKDRKQKKSEQVQASNTSGTTVARGKSASQLQQQPGNQGTNPRTTPTASPRSAHAVGPFKRHNTTPAASLPPRASGFTSSRSSSHRQQPEAGASLDNSSGGGRGSSSDDSALPAHARYRGSPDKELRRTRELSPVSFDPAASPVGRHRYQSSPGKETSQQARKPQEPSPTGTPHKSPSHRGRDAAARPYPDPPPNGQDKPRTYPASAPDGASQQAAVRGPRPPSGGNAQQPAHPPSAQQRAMSVAAAATRPRSSFPSPAPPLAPPDLRPKKKPFRALRKLLNIPLRLLGLKPPSKEQLRKMHAEIAAAQAAAALAAAQTRQRRAALATEASYQQAAVSTPGLDHRSMPQQGGEGTEGNTALSQGAAYSRVTSERVTSSNHSSGSLGASRSVSLNAPNTASSARRNSWQTWQALQGGEGPDSAHQHPAVTPPPTEPSPAVLDTTAEEAVGTFGDLVEPDLTKPTVYSRAAAAAASDYVVPHPGVSSHAHHQREHSVSSVLRKHSADYVQHARDYPAPPQFERRSWLSQLLEPRPDSSAGGSRPNSRDPPPPAAVNLGRRASQSQPPQLPGQHNSGRRPRSQQESPLSRVSPGGASQPPPSPSKQPLGASSVGSGQLLAGAGGRVASSSGTTGARTPSGHPSLGERLSERLLQSLRHPFASTPRAGVSGSGGGLQPPGKDPRSSTVGSSVGVTGVTGGWVAPGEGEGEVHGSAQAAPGAAGRALPRATSVPLGPAAVRHTVQYSRQYREEHAAGPKPSSTGSMVGAKASGVSEGWGGSRSRPLSSGSTGGSGSTPTSKAGSGTISSGPGSLADTFLGPRTAASQSHGVWRGGGEERHRRSRSGRIVYTVQEVDDDCEMRDPGVPVAPPSSGGGSGGPSSSLAAVRRSLSFGSSVKRFRRRSAATHSGRGSSPHSSPHAPTTQGTITTAILSGRTTPVSGGSTVSSGTASGAAAGYAAGLRVQPVSRTSSVGAVGSPAWTQAGGVRYERNAAYPSSTISAGGVVASTVPRNPSPGPYTRADGATAQAEPGAKGATPSIGMAAPAAAAAPPAAFAAAAAAPPAAAPVPAPDRPPAAFFRPASEASAGTPSKSPTPVMRARSQGPDFSFGKAGAAAVLPGMPQRPTTATRSPLQVLRDALTAALHGPSVSHTGPASQLRVPYPGRQPPAAAPQPAVVPAPTATVTLAQPVEPPKSFVTAGAAARATGSVEQAHAPAPVVNSAAAEPHAARQPSGSLAADVSLLAQLPVGSAPSSSVTGPGEQAYEQGPPSFDPPPTQTATEAVASAAPATAPQNTANAPVFPEQQVAAGPHTAGVQHDAGRWLDPLQHTRSHQRPVSAPLPAAPVWGCEAVHQHQQQQASDRGSPPSSPDTPAAASSEAAVKHLQRNSFTFQ